MKGAGVNEGLKGRLFKKQEGKCILCTKPLVPEYPEANINSYLNSLHIDHIKPISEGGSKTAISNLRLLHSWCHKNSHRSNKIAKSRNLKK